MSRNRKRIPASYLWDMLSEIEWVQATIHHETDLYDELKGRAALRAFTVIGEAAKRLDENTKSMASCIPWQKIIDTRNFISHEYEHINLVILWEVIRDYLPALHKDLCALYHTVTGTDYHAY